MPDVAFVTYREQPQLTPDDRPLLSELERLEWGARAYCWDDPGVRWTDFPAVVLRSCWDYHLRPALFQAWLADLDAQRVRLWNPTAVVRWNLDKHYLRELVTRGIDVPGTAWLDAGTAPDLGGLLAENAWAEVVIKPRVSASGYETWRSDRTRAATDQARRHPHPPWTGRRAW